MSEQMHIEQLVRSKLEGKEIPPSPGTWKRIQRRMRWKQFMRFDPGKFNIFYTAGILVIGAGLITLFWADPVTDRPEEQPVRQEPARQEITLPVDEDRESEPEETERREEAPATLPSGSEEKTEEGRAAPETREASPATGETAAKQVADQQQTDRSATHRSATGRSGEEAGPVPARNTLVAYFTCSVQSGCAPLTVRFFNQSVNHTTSSWSMGTGVPVTGENPVHTFTEPGRHHVTMTAVNEEGQTSSFNQVIEVYPVPQADFDIGERIRVSPGEEAYELINYSVGAASCQWDLLGEDQAPLQGWCSEEYQPFVPVSELGEESRYIRLVATSEQGCSHTALREIPDGPGTTAPSLRFPTAFSPNPSGPTGGHYSPHEKRNDIFHPVFETAPMEYRLRIYNRRGELVFETGDLYRGWDGYYLQERSAAGVYVWVAEGIRENGEEFMMQGDVTLIWSDQR